MKARHLLLGVTCASLLGATVLTGTAQAQDTIYVPLLTYRTGPFSGSGIPIANGMADKLAGAPHGVTQAERRLLAREADGSRLGQVLRQQTELGLLAALRQG